MAKKLLFGAALLGAGVYYYDQQVQPILPRNEKNKVAVPQPPAEVRKAARDTEAKAKELGSQARDFGSLVKKTVSLQADAAEKKTNSVISSIKDSETYNRWSDKLDSYGKDVKVAAEEVDQKPWGNWIAVKYIDFVNRLGQTKQERLDELASSTTLRQQEMRKGMDVKDTKWYSWWSSKKGEAHDEASKLANKAEAEKKSWFDWGNKKADEAEKQAKDAKKTVESETKSWLNWGSNKGEEAKQKAQAAHADAKSTLEQQQKELSKSLEAGKERAVQEYNRAKKNWDELVKQAGDKAYELTDDANLTRAKKDLENAGSNLKQYGVNLVEQVTGKN